MNNACEQFDFDFGTWFACRAGQFGVVSCDYYEKEKDSVFCKWFKLTHKLECTCREAQEEAQVQHILEGI